MLKRSRTVLVVSVVSAASVLITLLAIRLFGANNVQAFAGVMSLVAVIVAAGATVVYVQQTSNIANATRESAREQARVTRLMEQDLKLRIAPYLRFEPLGGPVDNPSGYVRNGGSGTAVDAKIVFRLLTSGREIAVKISYVLEPRHDHVENVQFGRNMTEGAYVAILTCTDSLKLYRYQFEWDESGKLTNYTVI
jgi:hypothetical protein